jgi:hypothetical protein
VSRLAAFTVTGLLLALLAGALLSRFASPQPDGLESAVLRTQCADIPEGEAREACLADAAGDPVWTGAPLPGYEITPLSGAVGVLLCFALGAGIVAVARAGARAR